MGVYSETRGHFFGTDRIHLSGVRFPMRTSAFVAAGLTAIMGLGAAQSAAQTPTRVLQLSFDAEGRVSLRAQNVTAREILAEWARLCSCYLVNAEKLPGDPVMVPLLFEQQAQSVVLSSLLRPAAGYVLTPRRAGSSGPSQYETIFILATSNPTASPSYATSTSSMPMPVPIATPGSPDNEIPPVPDIGTAAAGTVPPPGQSTAPKPNLPYPGAGMPSSVFVPIVPAPSNPFTAPTPARGGGPGTAPSQAPAPPPGGTVGTTP